MKFQFALYWALLALSFSFIGSQPPFTIVSTELFASPPVKVYDARNSTDYHHPIYRRTTQDTFSAGSTNDTLHLWAVDWDGYYIRGVNRRNLNATIIGTVTSEDSVIGDKFYTTAISATLKPIFSSCPGYFAIAAADTTKITITIFSATDERPTTVPVFSTQSVSTIGSFWYQAGYFYLVWWSNNIIYLQGVSTNGILMYTPEVIVVTTSESFSYNKRFTAGSSSCLNSTYIYVIFKPDWNLYTVQITKSTGAVGAPQTLVTELHDRELREHLYFLPAGVIGSCDIDGFGVENATYSMISGWTSQLVIFLNNTLTVSTDISSPTQVVSINYPHGGYFNFASYYDGIGNKWKYAYQTFYPNGTASSPQTFFATIISGAVSIFPDTEGAIWFGYTSKFSANYTQIGMIGKLFTSNQRTNNSVS